MDFSTDVKALGEGYRESIDFEEAVFAALRVGALKIKRETSRNGDLDSKIELLAEEVHNTWIEEKYKQGFHSPVNCPQRMLIKLPDERMFHKFEHLCPQCCSNLYSYTELTETDKNYDRLTVQSVLNAIQKLGLK